MSRTSSRSTRGYGLTPWGRRVVDVIEGRETSTVDTRRITTARRYFRDRHVHRLRITPGRVSASVSGSQLDPFDVTLDLRTVHTPTVAGLLRSRGATGDLMALARGEQPRVLGELIAPTESADIVGDCSCPDATPRCIHVLVVAYEVAAVIDHTPATLLTVMGTDLPSLLAEFEADGSSTSGSQPPDDDPSAQVRPQVDFYGTGTVLPPLPTPATANPMMDLDIGLLRSALRASGIAPGDVAEALDQLTELYDHLGQ